MLRCHSFEGLVLFLCAAMLACASKHREEGQQGARVPYWGVSYWATVKWGVNGQWVCSHAP